MVKPMQAATQTAVNKAVSPPPSTRYSAITWGDSFNALPWSHQAPSTTVEPAPATMAVGTSMDKVSFCV
jgi:hypothetical protein